MKFIIPVESVAQNKGGVILYDPLSNEIVKQYIHDKTWDYRVGWRGGIIYDDYLIATDWSDLHYFNIKNWKYEKSFKKRTFNDLHYLEVHEDQLYVVNTGLDTIEIFKNPLNPTFITSIKLFKRAPNIFMNRKFDKNEKYNLRRKVKPHSAHPNSICFGNKRVYVICFEKNSRRNSGEIITLDGKRVVRTGYSCHDAEIYNGNLYTTLTRQSKVLVFNDIEKRKLPIQKPDKMFSIKKRAWWRGSVIHDNILYVFASYRRKDTALMCTMNLKTGKTKFTRLPHQEGVRWDTVYQPNLYET